MKYAAWCQGDVAHPDALALSHIVAGVNFNECVYESIEVCGAGTQPFTAAQFEAVAQLLAAAHKATGLPDRPGARPRARRRQQREPGERPVARRRPARRT